MESTTRGSRRTRLLHRVLRTALAVVLAVAAVDTAPAQSQEEGQENAPAPAENQIQRQDPLSRVGMTEGFSATLDTAPEAVTWKTFRDGVAVRYEPGKSEGLDPGTRKHLVLHAAVVEEGEIRERHSSDPVELLPGATKLQPEAFLPESSMIPDGYRISNLMAIGEIEVQPGEIMTDLVRDIVSDMTRDRPALYLAPTPPEEQIDAPHKIHPVLVQLAPAQGGGAGG